MTLSNDVCIAFVLLTSNFRGRPYLSSPATFETKTNNPSSDRNLSCGILWNSDAWWLTCCLRIARRYGAVLLCRRSEAGNATRVSLRKNVSAAENVRVRLLKNFGFVLNAVQDEQCSTFAKEVSCGSLGCANG